MVIDKIYDGNSPLGIIHCVFDIVIIGCRAYIFLNEEFEFEYLIFTIFLFMFTNLNLLNLQQTSYFYLIVYVSVKVIFLSN